MSDSEPVIVMIASHNEYSALRRTYNFGPVLSHYPYLFAADPEGDLANIELMQKCGSIVERILQGWLRAPGIEGPRAMGVDRHSLTVYRTDPALHSWSKIEMQLFGVIRWAYDFPEMHFVYAEDADKALIEYDLHHQPIDLEVFNRVIEEDTAALLDRKFDSQCLPDLRAHLAGQRT
jgi:hypothetical protein